MKPSAALYIAMDMVRCGEEFYGCFAIKRALGEPISSRGSANFKAAMKFYSKYKPKDLEPWRSVWFLETEPRVAALTAAYHDAILHDAKSPLRLKVKDLYAKLKAFCTRKNPA